MTYLLAVAAFFFTMKSTRFYGEMTVGKIISSASASVLFCSGAIASFSAGRFGRKHRLRRRVVSLNAASDFTKVIPVPFASPAVARTRQRVSLSAS